jgi:hypothetical protein
MSEVLGPQTLLNLALPSGIDATRLTQWAMRDGVTYGELANQVALALGAFNQEMVNDWGWLFSITEELAMEYEQGGSVSQMPEITDIDKPEAMHGTTIGHMVDLRAYGRGIGGSKRYFRDARSAQVRAAISTIVRQARWRFEVGLLTRWFTNTENAVGSAGYDVPFVRGTGGTIDYAPPAFDGEAFTTSHNHYLGYNATTPDTLDEVLNGLAETLQEHGFAAPFTAMVSRADAATYQALSSFVQIVDPVVNMIDRGGATAGANFFAAGPRPFGLLGYFQGAYGLVEVRETARLSTGYAGMVKSFGQLDGRNALVVRVHPNVGFGAYVVPETTPDDDYPVKQLDVEMEHGISVGPDRAAGAAAVLVAGGTWANATIS